MNWLKRKLKAWLDKEEAKRLETLSPFCGYCKYRMIWAHANIHNPESMLILRCNNKKCTMYHTFLLPKGRWGWEQYQNDGRLILEYSTKDKL